MKASGEWVSHRLSKLGHLNTHTLSRKYRYIYIQMMACLLLPVQRRHRNKEMDVEQKSRTNLVTAVYVTVETIHPGSINLYVILRHAAEL